jgi:hypothetical protein
MTQARQEDIENTRGPLCDQSLHGRRKLGQGYSPYLVQMRESHVRRPAKCGIRPRNEPDPPERAAIRLSALPGPNSRTNSTSPDAS